MNFPDSVFCETPPIKNGCNLSHVKFDENVNKLADVLRKSEEPMDFFSISKVLCLPMITRTYSRHTYYYPDRAKRCVSALLKRFPGQFEMTTVMKTSKRGIQYSAPAVKVIRGAV